MRDTWCSHQLVGRPAMVSINTVEVAEGWQQRIVDAIRGRYTGARHFRTRGQVLLDGISACEGRMLDEVNIAMIDVVREMLGIATPLLVTEPPTSGGAERLLEQVKMVGGTSYLAGQGGRAYMGEDPEGQFAAEGLALEWSDHQPTTGDSIVTLLMDEDDPLGIIARRAQSD
jgi:hypothetical protein